MSIIVTFTGVVLVLMIIGGTLAHADKQNRGKGPLKRKLWPDDNEEGK